MHDQALWAEIDLQAVAHNCGQVRSLIPAGTRFMAVVKANAYGHGSLAVAQTALENGADSLAVARLDEAIELRRAGIQAPVLIFGHTPVSCLTTLLDYDLIPTMASQVMAEDFSRKCKQLGVRLPVHLKIDTGMGRLGINAVPSPGEGHAFHLQAKEQILHICRMSGLEFQGVYTHLAQADADDTSHAQGQIHSFASLLQALAADGLEFPVRHAANSAAVLRLPQAHLDLVRPGLMLYGLSPRPEDETITRPLRPAMTLKARVAQVKKVAPGFKISYGSTFTVAQETTIATIPVGYADGFFRILSNSGCMLIHGQRARIAGRICMDQTMLDVGHIPNVQTGDEVVIFGGHGNDRISVDETARRCSTINYEIVSSLMDRVPRIYPPVL
ncbi:MAG: alanine racemase [Desulfovermiculus sp.]|nr:alanine racemase [Desulfovermiculus sp.]